MNSHILTFDWIAVFGWILPTPILSLRRHDFTFSPLKNPSSLTTITLYPGTFHKFRVRPFRSKPDARITWFFNDKEARRYDDLSIYQTLYDELVLFDVSPTINRSKVKATITNDYYDNNTVESRQYLILIRGSKSVPVRRLEIVVKPRDVYVERGDYAIFDCAANGSPIDHVKIKWVHTSVYGRTVDINSGLFYGNRRLLLSDVDYDDQGIYRCDIEFQNYASVSASARLGIHEKPRITTNLGGIDIISNVRDMIELHCHSRGHPRPTATWYFNAEKITYRNKPNHDMVRGPHLMLKSLSLNDSGVYQCIVHNYLGYDMRAQLLVVRDRSRSPYLEGESITQGKWTIPLVICVTALCFMCMTVAAVCSIQSHRNKYSDAVKSAILSPISKCSVGGRSAPDQPDNITKKSANSKRTRKC